MPRHFIRRFWPVIVATVALITSGCGGGGASSGGSQTEPTLASAVRLGNTVYTSTKFSVFESASRLPGIGITADVTGDLNKLNGKVIYVVVVDPDGLFDPRPTLQLSANGIGNSLNLIGKPTKGRAGTYRGNLQLNVCVDEACQQPLGNSPILIPYDITIASGAKFASTSPLVVETTFGEPVSLPIGSDAAQTLEVAVTLPADTSRSNVNTPSIAGVDSPFWGLGMSNGKLQMAFYDAAPGVYDGVVRIETDSLLGGTLQSSVADLPVRYIVRANPAINVLFRPVPQEFWGNGHSQGFKLITADGKRYDSVSRIVYGPGGTNANGNKWLQVGLQGSGVTLGGGALFFASVGYCTASGFANCLYEGGIYQASVYFKASDGTELPTPLPITLRAR